MRTMIDRLFSDASASVRRKVLGLYAVLLAANISAWLWAFAAFHDHPVLLGTALLAYTFGLRHAVDADHIAAIDNVTRKLMQTGKRPVSVGFFFSLGHSTVVVLASAALAGGAALLESDFNAFRDVGQVIGTSVSALFLFVIALANILVFISVLRTFMAVKRGECFVEDDLDLLLSQRGLLGRLFRPVFGLISKSWHMYPLGFLFGLGFDTATEIGLLGISAANAAQGLPLSSIMVFPALFTAGMSLLDTTDAILMLGAYGWAFIKPIRKLYYNMTITLVSVIVALVVGGIEALGLVAGRLGLDGGFWAFVNDLNDHFGVIGYVIIAIFVVSWAGSMLVYKLKGYDDIEVRVR